jgi:hypothetical protein
MSHTSTNVKESEIEQYAVRRVKKSGGLLIKLRFIALTGAPDRIALFKGCLIWIEFKKPGLKPKKHQLKIHNLLRWAGQRVEVIDSFLGVDMLIKEITGRMV